VETTRQAFHHLPDSIPGKAFPLPSGNPVRTIGQMLDPLSLDPRFMVLDVQMIGGRRRLYRLLQRLMPKRLFDWLHARLTRAGARNLSRAFLAAEDDRAPASIRKALDSLSGEDFRKLLPYPGWDSLLTGDVSMEYLFGCIRHPFDSHAAQIEKTPAWKAAME
jgi:hypothetical protein